LLNEERAETGAVRSAAGKERLSIPDAPHTAPLVLQQVVRNVDRLKLTIKTKEVNTGNTAYCIPYSFSRAWAIEDKPRPSSTTRVVTL